MKPLTEPEIRAAFVNCSKGEAKRAGIPRNLSGQPWEDLDFLGWRDPQSPGRAYLAAEIDGRLVAIVLRCPGPGPLQKKTSMCSLCLTSHSGGVALMVAPRTGWHAQPEAEGGELASTLRAGTLRPRICPVMTTARSPRCSPAATRAACAMPAS